ncbi:MAG: transcriptional regulator [Planctomycetota bacterium]|nr:MAG: transcriptional regulator [Planctomycetota bacterium]
MIGERIKRARNAAGLSLRELGKRAELSATAISKFEQGKSKPTSQTLIRLARALGTRSEFFLRPTTVELQRPEYRKRSSLPKKQLARVEADILDQIERFLDLLSLFPTPPVARFKVPTSVPKRVASHQEVEKAALAVRKAWQLGQNAIPCLAATIEEHGVLVLSTNIDRSAKFDGLAASVGGLPVIALGADWPGDRQRFTMAHELGHLVLGDRLADGLDEEKACNCFAGAFLVPLPTVQHELGKHRNRLEPRELYALKHEYGLSMMGWVFRAVAAGVITDSTKTKIFRFFSAKGWRKQEPGKPIDSETPKLFERLVLRALAEKMISTSKAAELMGMSVATFRHRLRFEAPRGAAHQ